MFRQMRNGALKYVVISLLIAFISACQMQSDLKDQLPKEVKANVLIADQAEHVRLDRFKGGYEVHYDVKVCYPANDFIKLMVDNMTSQGFERLEYDYFNPHMILNHFKTPYDLWNFNDDGNNNFYYNWVEFWKNSKGIVVSYELLYHTKRLPDITKACKMNVHVLYILPQTKGDALNK